MSLHKDNNNLKDRDNQSMQTLHSLHSKHDEVKKYDKDSIPMRIEFIKNLLEGKELTPIVNFDCTDTENFIGQNSDLESGDSHDTRVVLKKRVLNLKNVITEIGCKLRYIKSGTTGHTFKGVSSDPNDPFEFAVKVVAYPKKERYGSIHDIRRPENAELMMIKLLSYFIVNKQTPHLVIPFATFNTDITNFVKLTKCDTIDDKNERYKEFIERYNNDEFSSSISVLISEWANKGDLLDFFRENYKVFQPKHWKVIFFQILSVLAIIQSKYPTFRHNDMKANNILIHKIDKTREYHKYVVARSSYRVPNIGYHIKLWDFDFACIPGLVDNIKVESKWTKKINVTPEQNRYYDIHYFFNTLIRKGFFPHILTDSCVPREVKEFIDRVVPKKYRAEEPYVHEKGRILVNVEYLTPDYILKNDPYFEEFRITKPGTVKERPTDVAHDINKILNSEQLTIPKSVYSFNTDAPKKKSTSKVEKNIDILKLLENSSNVEKEKPNILEQLDVQLKHASKLNRKYSKIN